jgi:hypothetical protein
MTNTAIALLLVGLLAAAVPAAPRAGPGGPDAQPPTAGGARQPDRPKGRFTVGKDTTHTTGPLDASGRVDHAVALNERLGRGVTPDTNAAVLLWKAMGPRPEGKAMPPAFFRLLGTPTPPERGDYFVDLPTFAGDRLKAKVFPDLAGYPGRPTSLPWTAEEEPLLAAWLAANEKPLALVVEATRRPHYFSPLVPDATDAGRAPLLEARLPGVQRARALGAALTARAMLRVGRGELDGAWADLLGAHRLGRLVGRGGCLIEALAGVGIEAVAARGVPAFIDRAGADAARLARCAGDLRELPPPPDVAGKVDLAERYNLLDVVMMIDRRGLGFLRGLGGKPDEPDPLADALIDGVDWDPALRAINRWYDRLAATLRERDRTTRVREYGRFEADIKALKKQTQDMTAASKAVLGAKDPPAAWGQYLGDVLVSLMLPAAARVQDAVDRARQGYDNLVVAFALARYRADRGGYPKQLGELTPKYLDRVPGDSFSGNPLVYRPGGSGYVLYSVGLNGRDDGGRGFDDDPPGDDVVVRMPPRDPRRP